MYGLITVAVPPGWTDLFFGWELGLDWTGYMDAVNDKIDSDGFQLIGYLMPRALNIIQEYLKTTDPSS